MSRRHSTRVALALGSYIGGMSPSFAHVGTGLPGGAVAGFEHPLSGFDHLLAMVSVGLWGAFLGKPLIYTLPVIFPLMMVVGALLGMLGAPLPFVDLGVAVSVVLLGLCIALAFRARAWVACVIVALFALFHGYSHGVELPSAADPLGYSMGFVVATGLLHLAGIGMGLITESPSGVRVARGLGAAAALTGLWFVYGALRP